MALDVSPQKFLTAREAGLIGCQVCGKVAPRIDEGSKCARCGAKLYSRELRSLQRVWAWLTLGIMAYIPANLLPMMSTQVLVLRTSSTIVGGAVELLQHGSYLIAAVILLASVAIPISKFVVIGYLALTIQFKWRLNRHHGRHLYEFVEFIGRWSMIDVFVVAVLAALVQLGVAARIEPGPGVAAFAVSVICTMIAAQSFDTRLIWDQLKEEPDEHARPGQHSTNST